jgi:hypothetical protein
MVYQLTEVERGAIAAIREQANAAQRNHERELLQLQAAINGMCVLMARQQGIFTGTETISMSEDFTTITVTDPPPTDHQETASAV